MSDVERMVRGTPLAARGLSDLADACGIDPNALSGATSIGLQDDYQLFQSPDFKPDAPSFGGHVKALSIRKLLRFGNSLQQVLNAVQLAAHWSVDTVFIPCAWYLEARFQMRGHAVWVVNSPPDLERPDHRSILAGLFFYPAGNLRSLYPPGEASTTLVDAIIHGFSVGKATPLSDTELVIHVRSGDIFVQPHRHYGQPPLAFYLAVLRSEAWSHVHLVFENKNNPVIDALLAHLAEAGKPTTVHSGTLAEDVEFLCRARNLVASRGSFTPAVALISRHVARYYRFEQNLMSGWERRSLDVRIVRDVTGDYRSLILAGNWENSEAQRKLMVDYPEQAVQLLATSAT